MANNLPNITKSFSFLTLGVRKPHFVVKQLGTTFLSLKIQQEFIYKCNIESCCFINREVHKLLFCCIIFGQSRILICIGKLFSGMAT